MILLNTTIIRQGVNREVIERKSISLSPYANWAPPLNNPDDLQNMDRLWR